MRRLLLSVVVLLTLAAVAAWGPRAGDTLAAQSRQAPAGTAHTGKAFKFNQVKPGIYHAIGTGALAVVGNSSFIVNDEDVIVVDDHVSPAAAWVLLEEIKEITNKPVRTVINTHFHFDHAHGNQIFDSRVDIIGHEFTRQMLLSNSIGMPLYRNYVTGLPGQIDDMKKRLAAETDAGRQAALRTQISVAENNRAAQAELKPTPPNVTLTDRMTLYRGSREIQIRFLGRGHTGGDVVVYLPRERVVAPPARMEPELQRVVEGVSREIWPGVPVVPTMETGGTDGYYLRPAGIPTFGVSGVFIDIDDVRAHGRDERVSIDSFHEGVDFYYRLIRALSTTPRRAR